MKSELARHPYTPLVGLGPCDMTVDGHACGLPRHMHVDMKPERTETRCSECDRKLPGHSIGCVTGNEQARKAQDYHDAATRMRDRCVGILKRWCKCGPRIHCSFCDIRKEIESLTLDQVIGK